MLRDPHPVDAIAAMKNAAHATARPISRMRSRNRKNTCSDYYFLSVELSFPVAKTSTVNSLVPGFHFAVEISIFLSPG
jgi:hypothetical protein